MYDALIRAYSWRGIDYDRALGNATHSFGTTNFFEQIRHQPCAPLLRMLRHRLKDFPTRGINRLQRRASRGDQLRLKRLFGLPFGFERAR